MTTFGITPQGFVLKRLSDILKDMNSALSQVQDPNTLETLNLTDENDPLIQLRDALSDGLAKCWEQLQMSYNQFIPTQSSGAALSGLVQLNGLIRELQELDSALRIRQQGSTEGTGYIQVDAIAGSVMNIPGVQFCKAYQNSTLTNPDSRGIPAKSIAVVVVGGKSQDVANAIFAKSGMDIGYYGNETATCFDTLKQPYRVSFVRPSPVRILINIQTAVSDSTQWPTDGVQQIKDAIAKYSQYGLAPNAGFYPGATIVVTRLYSPVNSVPGHAVQTLSAARYPNSLGLQPITMGWNEVASIAPDDITVTLV